MSNETLVANNMLHYEAELQRWTKALDSSRAGLSVLSLSPSTVGYKPPVKLCSFNSDYIFRAASLIKVPIIAALFYEAQQGRICLDDTTVLTKNDLVEGGVLCEVGEGRPFSWGELSRLAIEFSDNSASNAIIRQLGFILINNFIKSKLQVEHTVLRRFFMYSPQEMGENQTSASDCALILSKLWCENLLSGGWHREFWNIMGRQQFIEKIPSRLIGKAKTYNKTGELDDGARHDMAILKGNGIVLALAALTDQQEKPGWLIDWEIGAWAESVFHKFSHT
ncbi:MAG: serine hydrolase [Candidatus Bruticola sp.]